MHEYKGRVTAPLFFVIIWADRDHERYVIFLAIMVAECDKTGISKTVHTAIRLMT